MCGAELERDLGPDARGLLGELRAAVLVAHRDVASRTDGAVARYIPQLAEADPELFAVCACTVGGDLVVAGDADAALELYFQQCATLVTTPMLARMAAVLARYGAQPGAAGPRLLGHEAVRATLSVMYGCGLHDESGRFAFDAGLPAKRGISGAIAAVAPGRLGLAVHATGVNAFGTSVRGRAALVRLSRRLGLSVFVCGGESDAGRG